MKLEINKDSELELREVFVGVWLISDAGERLFISMRDTGFEFTYEDNYYEAKLGEVHQL